MQVDQQYSGNEIPRPDNWGGYILKPSLIEFWHDGENRLHDRFEYKASSSGAWTLRRLYP